jgi:rRNA maturation protein Rpf1
LQRGIPRGDASENTKIFQAMFVGESDLERKIQEAYVEDRLVKNYLKNLHRKRRIVKRENHGPLSFWRNRRLIMKNKPTNCKGILNSRWGT